MKGHSAMDKNSDRKKHSDREDAAVVVSLRDVSKQFKILYKRDTTVFERMMHIFEKNHNKLFYVLKDVNLEIKQGEFIGLIGANGSGKSTLLRVIAGIIEPTSGAVVTKGKIVPLIELGVGFQNELTAKENIYLYGAVMGISKKEIKQKYNKIVDLADTRKFMDTKLKNFSSGMVVRLAFATAIQTDPEILLLDEVLAVGDTAFQKKCFAVFEELKAKGVTVIFASHNLHYISRFCDKTICLNRGKVVMSGDTDKVIKFYFNEQKKIESKSYKPHAFVSLQYPKNIDDKNYRSKNKNGA